jgi:predicted DsbA family dithiol-disulfide isomerase
MSNILYFDFVDPLSYLQEIELYPLGSPIERVGFELVPPPEPLGSVHDERWTRRYAQARALAPSVALAPPGLVPWTRKAHELHLLAIELGRGDEVRRAIFEAYFVGGDDIGRVDRLVSLAASFGMDRTGVKAALDVDRHQEDVSEARRAAVVAGIVDTPTLVISGKPLRGFHNRERLGTLLP